MCRHKGVGWFMQTTRILADLPLFFLFLSLAQRLKLPC
jgi:hypothetical protein